MKAAERKTRREEDDDADDDDEDEKEDDEEEDQYDDEEEKEEKEDEKKTKKRNRGHSSSATGSGRDLSKSVAGFIESDVFAVCGGLITSFRGLRLGDHCVFRTSSKYVIAIVNSEHCKWCKEAQRAPVRELESDEVRTRAYLQGIFRVGVSHAVKLSELISALTYAHAKGGARNLPFTGTPPFCSVENVTHISGLALEKLIAFDREFVWGDNLIFTTELDSSR